jgi:release factor glutamine methyltransferase
VPGEITSPSVADLIAEGRGALSASSSPGLDAELLLAHTLEQPRSWVLAHHQAHPEPQAVAAFRELLSRRALGEPIAYLTGEVEWYGNRYCVTPAVLVPRPETELLLEAALEAVRGRRIDMAVDVGTGSGVLAVELARHLPHALVLAVDTSASALEVARRNIARHGLESRVELRRGDLLAPVPRPPDLVVANLPYLDEAMMAALDTVVRREPAEALYGGPHGIDLYARLLDQLSARRWRPTVVMEIDPRQADAMRVLAGENCAWSVRVERDYAGLERIVVLAPRGGNV